MMHSFDCIIVSEHKFVEFYAVKVYFCFKDFRCLK